LLWILGRTKHLNYYGNQAMVKKDTHNFQKYVIAAYFVGGKQALQVISMLQAEVGVWVGIESDLCSRIYHIYT
jgi:hypothetical protein